MLDYKYEAKKKLEDYEAKCRALGNIPEEIKRLELDFQLIKSATSDGTPVQGGGSRREDAMLSNIATREELANTLEQTKRWVKMVEDGLVVLDEDERLILQRMYISREKGGVDRLCESLCKERSAIYAQRDKALRKFTLALYGMTEN